MRCLLFHDTHFVWLDALSTLVNNAKKKLVNPNIILYHNFFIKCLLIPITLLLTIIL